ncbi:leucine-rich repeat-containing protein 14 [Salvelinus fontinalis]|uniref:leucine-rich repeat-containing protein 14 n=1 Tax=Salvelinus fontinalis TaxID=8038 RepID=UPI0024861FBC|nr:leucine-rich repeat-containing protein 14 [Salvelinus fontinalis]XP_055785219.1 leucine-rich repeat-containing protein 14 [Salvelinus fontinalis]
MVLPLVNLCAKEVVSDHSSSPGWLGCVPRELYRPLLEAAFSNCRPLAVGELVQRWPERTLRAGGRRQGQSPPNRLCVQALLLAVVRGLSDKRCALQVLDLCGLQCEEGGVGDPMGGWSLTVALSTMVVQARAAAQRSLGREGERERKRVLAMERERDVVKRERGGGLEEGEGGGLLVESVRKEKEETSGCLREDQQVKGVRRRMEMERRKESAAVAGLAGGKVGEGEADSKVDSEVVVCVRADLFVNARSWERVRAALGTTGPLKLQCRYVRVEELSVSSIGSLLDLLPRHVLLGVDIRYSCLGVAGLALLLPQLSMFPMLSSLRLHYCNLDIRRDMAGQEGAMKEMSQGLGKLSQLRRLSLTALRLPGHLRMLLSSFPQPLEVLELPYLSLTPADLSYLSCSPHASSLQQLDLSENRLDELALPSVRRLFSQASSCLMQLSLSGCGLTDGLLAAMLPSLSCCRGLKSLGLALNPLSLAGLLDLVRMAVRMPSLRQLLYPNPLEDYQPGLPPMPSSAQLLDWPLDELVEVHEATSLQLDRVVMESGRSDLILTCDLLNYNKDLVEQ